MTQDVQVIINLKANNPFDLKAKIETINRFSKLSQDEQELVLEFISSPKLIAAAKKNLRLIKTMYG